MIKLNSVHLQDNIELMKQIEDNFIDLIYIDPPFFSNKDYGDFNDKWKDIDEYLEFMDIRIKEMYRILKNTGSFYLHSDYHCSHYLKVLIDKIFGYINFINEIIWKRHTGVNNFVKNKFPINSDSIFLYVKNKNNYTFHLSYKDMSKNYINKKFRYKDKKGKYQKVYGGLHKSTGNTSKLYLKDARGIPITNLWTKKKLTLNSCSNERIDYFSQKPEELLKRIIKTSSNEGDIVADLFCGSGTTLAVAKRLRRNYIGCDINPKAIEITKRRINEVNVFKNITDFAK